MEDWVELNRALQNLLRLRTFPLAFRLFKREEELEQIPKLRRIDHCSTFCQIITLARTRGWTIGVTEIETPENCGRFLGFVSRPKPAGAGSDRVGLWFECEEDAKKQEEAMRKIPAGTYRAYAVSPLSSKRFEPHMVLIYGTPAQMMFLINALQWKDYERLKFYSIGESACSDAIAECYLSGKPALTIPCYGERRYGHVQEDELVMALPPAHTIKAVEGLNALYRAGVRYPIDFLGSEMDIRHPFEKAFGIEEIDDRAHNYWRSLERENRDGGKR